MFVIRPELCIKKVKSVYFGFMILNVKTLLQQMAIQIQNEEKRQICCKATYYILKINKSLFLHRNWIFLLTTINVLY